MTLAVVGSTASLSFILLKAAEKWMHWQIKYLVQNPPTRPFKLLSRMSYLTGKDRIEVWSTDPGVPLGRISRRGIVP